MNIISKQNAFQLKTIVSRVSQQTEMHDEKLQVMEQFAEGQTERFNPSQLNQLSKYYAISLNEALVRGD